MTDESDDPAGRRPPTIDLTATEVDTKKAAEAENAAAVKSAPEQPATERVMEPSPPRTRSGSHIITGLIGGIIGAIAIAGAIVALQVTDNWPIKQGAGTPAPIAVASDNSAIADLTTRVNRIQSVLSSQQADPALGSRLAAVEAKVKSLSDSLTALNGRVDQVASTAQGAQTQARTAADAAVTAKNGTQDSVARDNLDALTSRVADLESAAKSLSNSVARQTAGGADDKAARLVTVTEALNNAIGRGKPFQVELATLKSLGADQTAVATLEPLAATGVPTVRALAQELSALSPALTEASVPKQSQGTFIDRIENSAQQLVRSTPINAPAGDDPRSVALRIGADATRNDIDAALSDIAKLPDAAKNIAAPWVQKAQTRNAAVAASLKLTANAIAALSKPQ